MMYYKICNISDIDDKLLLNCRKQLNVEQIKYVEAKTPKNRRQSLAVRALLFKLLSEVYPAVTLSSFCNDACGKPYFETDNVYVSITHSDDIIGCAISDKPIGIDVQVVKGISRSHMSRIMNSEELAFINGSDKRFILLWSIKEAYKKATGCSFAQLKNVSFVENNSIKVSNGILKYDIHDDFCVAVYKIEN